MNRFGFDWFACMNEQSFHGLPFGGLESVVAANYLHLTVDGPTECASRYR